MAKAEEKAVATKKSSEIASRVEDIEHWMERFLDDVWRRPFPQSLRTGPLAADPTAFDSHTLGRHL